MNEILNKNPSKTKALTIMEISFWTIKFKYKLNYYFGSNKEKAEATLLYPEWNIIEAVKRK